MKLHFWQFFQFKNLFLAIFEIAKNGIWSKKIICEIDLFDFTSFLNLPIRNGSKNDSTNDEQARHDKKDCIAIIRNVTT